MHRDNKPVLLARNVFENEQLRIRQNRLRMGRGRPHLPHTLKHFRGDLFYCPAAPNLRKSQFSSGVDTSKARRVLGWEPQVSFRQLVEMMVDHDLELADVTKLSPGQQTSWWEWSFNPQGELCTYAFATLGGVYSTMIQLLREGMHE